jgi:nucleoside-diphosphate-sugar epimerase
MLYLISVAAFSPDAVGKRILITSITEPITLKQIAKILQEEFGPKGYKISTDADQICEKEKDAIIADDSLMRNILGIVPIDVKRTIIETAYSLIEQNLVKRFEKKKSFRFQYFNKKS